MANYYEKAEIMDSKAMTRAITRISFEIIERNKGIDELYLIGLMSRGVYLAQRIAEKITSVENKEIPVGMLDITPFRDDISKEKVPDQSEINFEINNKKIVLIDDVAFTGRSVRAAIDAIMTRGRPKLIQFAVLVDRGHRELPIRPDYVGKNLPTSREEIVKVMMMEKDNADKVVICEEKNRKQV